MARERFKCVFERKKGDLLERTEKKIMRARIMEKRSQKYKKEMQRVYVYWRQKERIQQCKE